MSRGRESSSHEQAPFIATTHTCSHPPALLLGRNVTDTGRVLLMASLLSCAIVQFVPGAGQCGHCHFIFSQIRRGDEEGRCVPAVDIYNSVSSIITGFLRPPAPAPLHTHYSLVTADKGKVKGVVVSILHTERVMKSADTQEGPVSMLAASCGQRWRLVIELQTKVSEDFTITEEASLHNGALSWLKTPTSAFTFKTLLKHYA